MVEKSLVSRQEAKTRELETKLEFEKTQVKRLEVRVKPGGGLLVVLVLDVTMSPHEHVLYLHKILTHMSPCVSFALYRTYVKDT